MISNEFVMCIRQSIIFYYKQQVPNIFGVSNANNQNANSGKKLLSLIIFTESAPLENLTESITG